MNKEIAIGKIRTMGKAGFIAAWVLGALEVLGILAVVFSLILTAVIPDKLMTAELTGSAVFTIDLNELPSFMRKGAKVEVLDESETKELFEKAKDGLSVEVAGMKVELTDVRTTEDSVAFEGQAGGRTFSIHDISRALLAPLVILLLTLVTTFFAGMLCRAVRDCASPFDAPVIRGIKALAYSLIPWAFLDWLQEIALFPLSGGSHNFTIDLSMVCVVLVVLGLAYIFQYGAVLQQESDETL